MYPSGDVHEILYGTYSPLSEDCLSEEFCAQQFTMTETVAPQFDPYYSIRYSHPETSRRVKYLKKLIHNAAIEYLNSQIQDLSDHNRKEIAYAMMTVRRHTVSVLQRATEIITENNLILDALDAKNTIFATNPVYYEAIHIFNYIVSTAMYIFVEFQEQFKEYLSPEKMMTIEELYTIEMKVAVPENIPVGRIEGKAIRNVNPTDSDESREYLSFKYKDCDTNPEAIKDLFNCLRDKNKFIAGETSFIDFRRVFTGGIPVKKIVWEKGASALNFFIKYIHNEKKYVEDTDEHHWEITVNCFKQPDGSDFDRTKIRTQQKPAASIREKLIKAGDLLS